jgi:hypothetical protein
MTVSRDQRHLPGHECRICDGHERLPRHRGERCDGYTSPDGRWVRCRREQYAGALQPEASTGLYVHDMIGVCRCGRPHDGTPVPRPAEIIGPGRRRTRGRRDGEDPGQLVATYTYHDRDGALVYRVLRYRQADGSKTFRQQQPNPACPGKWIPNLEGVTRVLYRWPELVAAIAADPDATVYIVEGERDVEALRLLGLTATCNSEGAGKWRPTFAEELRGCHVVVLPDNDDRGRAHAEQVARSLAPVAASVKVLALPRLPQAGDVSDWLAAGGTRAHLEDLATVAPQWQPEGVPLTDSPAGNGCDPHAPCRARIAEVERRIAVLDQQVAQLQRRHDRVRRLIRNKHVKPLIGTAVAIANVHESRVSRGEDPTAPLLVRRKQLAREAGCSVGSVSNHIRTMERAGRLRRVYVENRPGTVVIDRNTGETNEDDMTDLYLVLEGDPDTWLDSWAEYDPQTPERRGGKRHTCPTCGAEGPSTTTSIRTCDECGHELERTITQHGDRARRPASRQIECEKRRIATISRRGLSNFDTHAPVSPVVDPLSPKFDSPVYRCTCERPTAHPGVCIVCQAEAIVGGDG